MCGIVGFTNKIADADAVIGKMMDRIRHRGPDASGKYIDDGIALGHRRLSIIDISSQGDQPIFNEDRSLVLVFNGEIYNYRDIREELIKAGHKFATNTDSEVLIHGYEQYGTKLLGRLRGMFSFVIWDSKKGELFGARDFFGIKPMYYALMGDTFMFGSEIKSFLEHPDFKKELNEAALENYLTFQYSPTSETFFKNVYKLMPAHYFIYKDGQLDIKRYWDINFEADEKPDLKQWVNDISDTFKNSFTSEYYSPIIEMKIRDKCEVTVNEYVRAVRYKYWEALFKNPDFTKQMTSNLQSKYSSKIIELKDYDFNEYNIREIKYDITKNLIKGVEDCIIDLFDELTRQYSWYDTSENIHYYNGWKTNKAWIINKKVVMPYDAFEDVWDYEGYRKVSKPRRLRFGYSFIQKLSDIEKVLNYLDDGSAVPVNMYWQIENAKNNDITKNIRLKHFSITVFKKGTCHITFNNEELLKKFNIFGSQHKGWLPPSYGKKTYDEMNEEEKEVIDEFEGKESYEKTLLRKDYFLAGAESMLMLTDGVSNSEKSIA